MSTEESIIVRQWRRQLIDTPKLLMLDGRTKEAKKRLAQRNLLISIASDEELVQMAWLEAEFFYRPVDEMLEELKQLREETRKTVKSWRKSLNGKGIG